MKITFIYKCPTCGKKVIFKSLKGYQDALKHNKLCRICRDKIKGENKQYFRNCPECNTTLYYKYQSDWHKANITNSLCKKCSASHSTSVFKKGNIQYSNNISACPKYSLDNLLLNTLESYYWLGFILADGSFYNHRFELSLNEKDIDQLYKICEFLNVDKNVIKYRSSTKSYRLSFNNENSIKNIMNKFGISYCKTYNPCDFSYFSSLSDDKLVALLIGIIDGDGNITKDKYINITAHKSWKKFYQDFIKKLNLKFYINDVNNTNCIKIFAGNKETRLFFINFLQKYKLPILERKWTRLTI